ncbi:TenA family transcriptional regulator [Rhodobacteraceae bacterium 2CG4]|uniref:Aminopyrimidine aminohydrolase n=1 Tax=Halovulum marinum TaxID=2662447 RepID=A0A6L5YXS9_9RHOB|nr:TenA family protein [Halovulum marinum]MSU88625.1 TenA family transcriptional regulator [Halovulum marinum]
MPEPLTDRILAENAEVFAAMVNHRFVQDIAADALPAQAFDRYLLIEGGFVETAIAIFGYAVAKASDLGDRRKMIDTLNALANEQMAYFERAYAQRAISPDPELQSDPRVATFRDGMLAIARDGDFGAIVTAMFAAEWMYWTWCTRLAEAPISDPMLRDWVDMHAAPGFTAQARWLRDRLDALGEEMTEVARSEAVRVFGHVQQLEIAFHSAIYADASIREA